MSAALPNLVPLLEIEHDVHALGGSRLHLHGKDLALEAPEPQVQLVVARGQVREGLATPTSSP